MMFTEPTRLPWWWGLSAAEERLLRRLDGLPNRDQSQRQEHVYWCEYPERDCICPGDAVYDGKDG